MLQLLLSLNLAEQEFASVHKALYAVHDACFLATSETTAGSPGDTFVPTHAGEGKELAMGLRLSLALHKSGLYFLLARVVEAQAIHCTESL